MNLPHLNVDQLRKYFQQGFFTLEQRPRPVREPIINRSMVVGIVVQTVAITAVVLAAFFVGLGLPAAEVTAYLDHVHKARGTSGWPESSWQADALRQFDIEHGGRP